MACFRLETKTAAAWTAENPRLARGQVGVETDPDTGAFGKAKLADGVRRWNDLEYWDPDGGGRRTKTVVVEHTDILTLPTLGYELFAEEEGSSVIRLLEYAFVIPSFVEPYTNVGAYPYSQWSINTLSTSIDPNDVFTDEGTQWFAFFPQRAKKNAASFNFLTGDSDDAADYMSKSVKLRVQNLNDAEFTDLGDFEGGHDDNALQVTVMYSEHPVLVDLI